MDSYEDSIIEFPGWETLKRESIISGQELGRIQEKKEREKKKSECERARASDKCETEGRSEDGWRNLQDGQQPVMKSDDSDSCAPTEGRKEGRQSGRKK